MEKKLQDILDDAQDHAKSWIIKKGLNTKSGVDSILDKYFKDVVIEVLGLTDHWGRWEVDHCNGRAGESTIGNYIKEKCKDQVEAWVTKHIDKFPSLSKEQVKAIQKEYLSQLEWQLKERARAEAINEARRIFTKLIQIPEESSNLID